MRISEMLITVFVIAMFSTGFVAFYAAMLNANGIAAQNFSYVNNTSATVSSLNNIYNRINTSQSQSSGLSGGIVAFAPINLLFGAFDAIMMAFQVPIFFYSLITDLTAQITGFPLWIAGMLTNIIMVIFISALIYLIIGRPF